MFRSVISRFLSVVTVLTLLLFGLTAALQPEPTLASPGISAPIGDTTTYLDDDANGNHEDADNNNHEDDENNGEDESNENNENNENNEEHENEENNGDNNGNNGGGGFFNPCVFPWFAANPACTFGLFGG